MFVFSPIPLLFIFFFVSVYARNTHQISSSGGLRRSGRSANDFRNDLRVAVANVLGEGHDVHHGHLEGILQKILPMWRSLPKNDQNRVDRRSLRYAVHRFFMQEYSLSIIGLEPAQVSGQHDEAVLLTQFAPEYVKVELEERSAQLGFSIEDAVVMIATIERFIADTSHELLSRSYEAMHQTPKDPLGREAAINVLDAYMLRWMLGEDIEGLEELESNSSLLEESLEDWHEVTGFVRGTLWLHGTQPEIS